MKNIVYCLLVMLLLFGNKAYTQQSETFKWLTGTWKISAGAGTIVEQWHIVNDSTLAGKSIYVKNGKDTIPQETVELVYRNGDWYYISTVPSQNNHQPVKFKVIYVKGAEFISENPAHDFPQRIAYRRIKHQLFASIEGKKNGRYGKQNFDFTGE
jgi:hypothetical protein